jgi:hypothetical protein
MFCAAITTGALRKDLHLPAAPLLILLGLAAYFALTASAFGASDPLPSAPARVGLLDRQPTLGTDDGNYSSCPIPFSNGSRDGGSIVSDIDAVGCLRSLRAHVALDGVSWVQSGSVEIAVGQKTACYRIGAVICSLPRASLRSGAAAHPALSDIASVEP